MISILIRAATVLLEKVDGKKTATGVVVFFVGVLAYFADYKDAAEWLITSGLIIAFGGSAHKMVKYRRRQKSEV